MKVLGIRFCNVAKAESEKALAALLGEKELGLPPMDLGESDRLRTGANEINAWVETIPANFKIRDCDADLMEFAADEIVRRRLRVNRSASGGSRDYLGIGPCPEYERRRATTVESWRVYLLIQRPFSSPGVSRLLSPPSG